MFKLRIILCSVILCLILRHSEGYVFGEFKKNALAQLLVPHKDLKPPEDKITDHTKGMNIIISPVIHNVAQNYGSRVDRAIEVSTEASTNTIRPPNLISTVSNICMTLKKEFNTVIHIFQALFVIVRILLNSMLAKMQGLLFSLMRSVFCSFVPICGFFGVLGDEVDDEALDIAEVNISRGLNFVQDIIELYHSVRNGTN